MPALNIRDVSEVTMRKLRVESAQRGMTLRDYVLERLEGESVPPEKRAAVNVVRGLADRVVVYGED